MRNIYLYASLQRLAFIQMYASSLKWDGTRHSIYTRCKLGEEKGGRSNDSSCAYAIRSWMIFALKDIFVLRIRRGTTSCKEVACRVTTVWVPSIFTLLPRRYMERSF